MKWIFKKNRSLNIGNVFITAVYIIWNKYCAYWNENVYFTLFQNKAFFKYHIYQQYTFNLIKRTIKARNSCKFSKFTFSLVSIYPVVHNEKVNILKTTLRASVKENSGNNHSIFLTYWLPKESLMKHLRKICIQLW